MPGWNGGFVPSTLDDAGRALQGALTRQWYWSNVTATTTGTASAYVVTYSVAPAALYTGQVFRLIAHLASTGAGTLNINSLGAKDIKKASGGALVDIAAGDLGAAAAFEVYYNGTYFVLVDTPSVLSTASTTEALTGTDTAKALTANALAALWEQGSDVASATTISVGEGGYFNVTGTTTITDIDFATDKAGRKAWVKFAGALTLTHNATTLILPGGANITTAAGDTALFVSEGSDNVRCAAYHKTSGAPVSLSYGGPPHIAIEDQQTSGTNGGTSAAGTQTRTLNTVVRNIVSGASLASNQITLPAGTYWVEGFAPVIGSDAAQAIWYNATDASILKRGTNAYVFSGSATPQIDSVVTHEFTIAAAKAFELRHHTQTSQPTVGLGKASSLGTEIYSRVKIWKLA